MKMFLPFVGVLLVVSASAGAGAAILSDPKIRGAKYCTDQFSDQERMHGIPRQTLAALANTESGRWNDKLGMVLPWPWTINAEGKGYYFNSKAEAISKVKALQAQGMKSIDIGCMQVNLKHHPKAFSSIEQAFDPRYNVAYAAKFLRRNYEDLKNWNKAIAAYHSRTPKYGNKYLARVQKSLDAITGKVGSARTALAGLREERRSSPSYRVVKVYDKGSRQFASLRKPKKTFPLGTKQPSFALSVSDAKGKKTPNGKSIRAVDRLNTSAVHRVAIKKGASTGSSGVMSIRLDDGANARRLSSTAASSRGRGGFVSHFGADTAKQTSDSTKPKFIFVE